MNISTMTWIRSLPLYWINVQVSWEKRNEKEKNTDGL